MRSFPRGGRFAVCALLLLISGTASAQVTVVPINLQELCERSGTIVAGRVISIRPGRGPQRLPIKQIVLQVRELLKSTDRGADPRKIRLSRRYEFKQVDLPELRHSDSRLPEYAAGQEVVLFLAPVGPLGLTAPMGLGQGAFDVLTQRKDGRTERLVLNSVLNANLDLGGEFTQGLGARAAKARLGLGTLERRGHRFSAWERTILTRELSGPVDYRLFLDLVAKLAKRRSAGR